MFYPATTCRSTLASLVFFLGMPVCGFSQEVLDEIVVTADFRGRGAADIPSAISVLGAESIEENAIQHFEELIGVVPNLNWSGDGHRARYFQIRGVGELEQYEGAPNPSVGFLIDDIDFSGIGTIATLFDIQQIEVLRGPQGSRYGANALAGLINVQSADPTERFAGQVRLSAGQDNTIAGGLALGGPIGANETLGYRVSVHHYEGDGFRHNSYSGRSDTNGRDETTARGKLTWEPGDWQLKLTAMFSDIDDGYDAFAIDNTMTMLSNRPGRDAQRSVGSSLKAHWRVSDRWTFTSLTSAASSDIDFSFDADWGNEEAWAPITYDYISESVRERKTVSQEFRFASGDAGRIFGDTTDWLIGVYGLRLNDDLNTNNQGEYLDPGVWADSLDAQYASSFEARNIAIFGQLETAVGNRGRFSFGLRVEQRSTNYNDSSSLSLAPDETMVGGNISYNHALGDAATGYVTLAKGYKAGGFNLGYVPDEDQREYDQENLWNLEVGIKSTWLQDTISIDGAIFYNRRNDQQVRTSLQEVPGDPTTFVFFTDNAATGTTLGFEAELVWMPSEAWELYANLGLLDAEFSDFYTLQTGDTELTSLEGRGQAHAPDYTFALGGEYRHPSGVFARLDLSAKDAFYFDVSHNERSRAYQALNARLGYETERWTAQFWFRNLTDEAYAVRGFYFGNEPPNFPNTLYTRQGDPRQFGLSLDMRF